MYRDILYIQHSLEIMSILLFIFNLILSLQTRTMETFTDFFVSDVPSSRQIHLSFSRNILNLYCAKYIERVSE